MSKKATTPAAIDTTLASAAHALAVQYTAEIEGRLPAGTIATLAADLTLLGASPAGPPVAPPPVPVVGAPPVPTLPEALATLVHLVTAVHEAIAGAKAKSSVRKLYGASSRAPVKEAKAVLASANKIITRAKAEPSEAVMLGILPTDVAALEAAVAALVAAETAAHGGTGIAAGTTAKAKHAAVVRMHDATARIAGAGALAFALNAAVRHEFEALKVKKAK